MTLTITTDGARAIPATALGENYWSWVTSYGAQVKGTEDLIKPLKLGTLRLGGTNADDSLPEAYTADVIAEFVTYSRTVGAEPIVQIPVVNAADGTPATAENAGKLVAELNLTRKLGIKYFSIGNEPDLYVDQMKRPATFSAADECKTFAAFNDAMKAVDPTIKVIGPELSWKYIPGNDWLSSFLEGCKTKVDIVSVHRYPVDPAKTTAAAALADAAAFRERIHALRSTLDAAGLQTMPLAITEANLTWDGDPAKSTLEASPGTFPAGLWVADTAGVAIEEGLWTYGFWSLSEGWTLGFLDGKTPRPAYHALHLFGEHFGEEVLTVSGAPSTLSAYASRRKEGGIAVIILNKDVAAHPVSIGITGAPGVVPGAARVLPPLSISALELDTMGAAHLWTYTEAEAKAGVGPKMIE